MKAPERKNAIIEALKSSDTPLSGSALAKRFDVSRQIIVSDISALKAEGYPITSTHSGYTIEAVSPCETVIKVRHTRDETEDELRTIVELGGIVANVYVWHKVYGRIEAPLDIASQGQIDIFMDGVRSGKSTELMNITGGYHYHVIRAESCEILERIKNTLEKKGYIVPEI